jgi:hypothetical protein
MNNYSPTVVKQIKMVRNAVACYYAGIVVGLGGDGVAVSTHNHKFFLANAAAGAAIVAGTVLGIKSGFNPPKALLGKETIEEQAERAQRDLN